MCPLCGGPALVLGLLGRMLWRQCRNCGHECGQRLSGDELADATDELADDGRDD